MSNNLDNIIKKVLLEYKDPNTGLVVSNNYDPSGGIGAARIASGLPATGNLKFDNQVFNKQMENTRSVQASSCVPGPYVSAIRKLKDSGASTVLLKATLGIIGRESDFGGGESMMSKKWWSYKLKSQVKNLKSLFDDYSGDPTSLGPAQITPQTAKQYGINPNDLNDVSTAVNGAYKILVSNYNLAIKNGYSTNKPSSNFKNGTGNAALDLAIAGHNLGESKMTKYCETSNPNIKKFCSLAGKVEDGVTVYNKPVANYLPNYGTKLTTHNYVAEVAKRMKSFSCVDNDWSGSISKVFNTLKSGLDSGYGWLSNLMKSPWDSKPGDLRYWKALYSAIGKAGLSVKLDPKANGKIENANYFYYGPWVIWKDTSKNGGYPVQSGNGTINKTSVVGKITTYGGKYAGEDISKTIVQLKGGNGKRYYLTAFLKSKPDGLVYQNNKK
jgi:hypothetical protein